VTTKTEAPQSGSELDAVLAAKCAAVREAVRADKRVVVAFSGRWSLLLPGKS